MPKVVSARQKRYAARHSINKVRLRFRTRHRPSDAKVNASSVPRRKRPPKRAAAQQRTKAGDDDPRTDSQDSEVQISSATSTTSSCLSSPQLKQQQSTTAEQPTLPSSPPVTPSPVAPAAELPPLAASAASANNVQSLLLQFGTLRRDASSKPILPFRRGNVVIVSLGTLILNRPGFNTPRQLYPAGYHCIREMHGTLWHCRIMDRGNPEPRFLLTSADGQRQFEDQCIVNVWRLALSKIKTHGLRWGLQMFGLRIRIVQQLLQELPNYNQSLMSQQQQSADSESSEDAEQAKDVMKPATVSTMQPQQASISSIATPLPQMSEEQRRFRQLQFEQDVDALRKSPAGALISSLKASQCRAVLFACEDTLRRLLSANGPFELQEHASMRFLFEWCERDNTVLSAEELAAVTYLAFTLLQSLQSGCRQQSIPLALCRLCVARNTRKSIASLVLARMGNCALHSVLQLSTASQTTADLLVHFDLLYHQLSCMESIVRGASDALFSGTGGACFARSWLNDVIKAAQPLRASYPLICVLLLRIQVACPA